MKEEGGWGGPFVNPAGHWENFGISCTKCGKTATLWQELHVVGGKLREGIRRSLFKPREPAAKHKLHAVHRAVALLRDLQLRLFPFLGRRALLEEMRPVDEHHHVGILFDGARLAQIRKRRPAFVALRRPRKLAEHKHGNLQFLREALQAPRDARDLSPA